MAKWKVIPVREYKRQDVNAAFILVDRTIVAPHFIKIQSYHLDGSCKKIYVANGIKNNFIRTTEVIPKNEKISVEYFTVVKMHK